MKILGRLLIASATGLLAVACSAADSQTESEENVNSSDEALQNNGGGVTLSQACTSCGCSMVFIGWENGCRQYRCECDSVDKAKCVVGKNPTASATVRPPRVVGTYVTNPTEAVLSP